MDIIKIIKYMDKIKIENIIEIEDDKIAVIIDLSDVDNSIKNLIKGYKNEK